MHHSDDAGVPVSRAGVMLLNECLDMVDGSHAAAVMLSQLIYWYTPGKNGTTRLRIQRDGHFWVVKTCHDWYDECRLTRRQVNRALSVLRARGLIVTQVHGFKGKKATFIRLLDTSIIPFAKHQTVQYPPDQSTKGCNAMHQTVHFNTVDVVQETTNTLKGDHNMKIKGGKEGVESEQVKNLLLSKEKAKKNIPLENLKKNSTALSGYWHEWIIERYPELTMMPSLNAKEMGQLSMLVKAIGANPLVMLRWLLFNWESFKARVAIDHGKKVTAKYPNVGVALMYRDSVVHGYAVAMQLIAHKPKTVPVPEKSVTEEKPQSTVADIEAALKYLNE